MKISVFHISTDMKISVHTHMCILYTYIPGLYYIMVLFQKFCSTWFCIIKKITHISQGLQINMNFLNAKQVIIPTFSVQLY